MKKNALGLLLVLITPVVAVSQPKPPQLEQISKLLKAKVLAEMPGWTHKSVEPIEGSKGVAIDQFYAGDLIVKVAVTDYKTVDEATKVLARFERRLRVEAEAAKAKGQPDFQLWIEDSPPTSDRNFVWKIRGSDVVAIQQGRYVVFISVVRPEPHVDSYFSKRFARFVVDVLTSL